MIANTYLYCNKRLAYKSIDYNILKSWKIEWQWVILKIIFSRKKNTLSSSNRAILITDDINEYDFLSGCRLVIKVQFEEFNVVTSQPWMHYTKEKVIWSSSVANEPSLDGGCVMAVCRRQKSKFNKTRKARWICANRAHVSRRISWYKTGNILEKTMYENQEEKKHKRKRSNLITDVRHARFPHALTPKKPIFLTTKNFWKYKF